MHSAEDPAVVPGRWSLEWLYFSFVVVAWSFSPLVRRLLDYRAGAFNPVQPASLIPYIALLPMLLVCFRRERLERLSAPFRLLAWVWLAAFSYGMLIAFAVGNESAAAFELVENLFPVIAGIWIAGQPLPIAGAHRRFALIVLACAAIVAAYGLVQWIQPQPWDVMWVLGNDFETVGSPEPFAMRVFSTLNSPGTAGDFFALTMLIVLPWLRLRKVWVWPLLSALGAALMLTLVREAWVGLIVGGLVYLIASPRRLATAPLIGLYAALMVVLAVTLPPMLGSRNADVITERFSTLADVSHDTSALQRQSEIADAMDQGLSNPVGSGLGVFGAASKLGSNPALVLGNILDSGYLARLIELGWPGALGFLFVVICGPLLITYALFRPQSNADVDARIAGALILAIAVALAWGEAADDAHDGLDGFFFWIALGLGSLAVRSGSAPVAAAVRKSLPRFLR